LSGFEAGRVRSRRSRPLAALTRLAGPSGFEIGQDVPPHLIPFRPLDEP
jgi:hypothetical protein